MNYLIRNILLACVVATVSGSFAGAQNLKIASAGEVALPDGTIVYSNPSTTLFVDVTVRHEAIRKGEYARYAQKYLGVIAPLADRESYVVETARIQWTDTDTPQTGDVSPVAGATFAVPSHMEPGPEFMRVLPDKLSYAAKNPETAAKEAADMIYTIRKRRYELVSGDMGEHVYGEGLRAAIERLDRMENEYLELFLGKHSIRTFTERFRVVPQTGKTTYVFARWNASKGFLPVEELSGEPIVLELTPRGYAHSAYPAMQEQQSGKSRDRKPAVAAEREYVVADQTDCRVVAGKRSYGEVTIPVYQMGVRITR